MDAKWLGLVAAIVSAGIGFIGGVLGQRYNTERAIHLERMETVATLRSETYLSFFSAQAKLQQARQYGFENYGQWLSENKEDSVELPEPLVAQIGELLWEYELETKEARMKVAAFAPTSVVESLSGYYREHSRPPDECSGAWKDDVKIYVAMRNELLEGLEIEQVDPGNLYLLMQHCIPPGDN